MNDYTTVLNNLRFYSKGKIPFSTLQEILNRYYNERDPNTSLVQVMNDAYIFNRLEPWDQIYWRLRLNFPRVSERQIKLLSVISWNQTGQVERAYQVAESYLTRSPTLPLVIAHSNPLPLPTPRSMANPRPSSPQ